MRHYYHLIGEFVIHEGGNNVIIDIDGDGQERQYDASLDPRYNRELNQYLATRKHWEISESQFRQELEEEKAEVARRCTEMDLFPITCCFLNAGKTVSFINDC